jgi:bacterioferritin-associated ferredoxin
MIVCSCNRLSDAELKMAVLDMLASDPWQLIVPNKLLHFLASRGKCGFCFKNIVEIIVSTTEEFHASSTATDDKLIALKKQLSEMRQKHERWLLLVRQSAANR